MSNLATHDKSQQSARAFRTIMNAMVRPGQVAVLPLLEHGVGLALPTSMTVLLSLCDHLTTIYLAPSLTCPALVKALRFHTGTRISDDSTVADFALVQASGAHIGLQQWKCGTHEYPDRSTTLIVQTPSLADGVELDFSGPGMKDTQRVRMAGVDVNFWSQRAEINASYPLGLDFIFVTETEILGCPRTTRVATFGGG